MLDICLGPDQLSSRMEAWACADLALHAPERDQSVVDATSRGAVWAGDEINAQRLRHRISVIMEMDGVFGGLRCTRLMLNPSTLLLAGQFMKG